MVYKEFSKDEKLSLVALLNWDYTDSAEDLLSVVSGKSKNSASFSEESLFARSLESLKWGDLVNLWTLERCVSLYTPTLRRMIRSDLEIIAKDMLLMRENSLNVLTGEI